MENRIQVKISEESGLIIRNNREIIVPKGVRYIDRDWKEYSLNWFPFQHILDKKIPGCGYTEYCIKSKIPIILCSPRKVLLNNKTNQHPEVYYFKNELESDLDLDKDLTKIDRSAINNAASIDTSIYEEKYLRLKEELLGYTRDCIVNFKTKTPKILVTYDSFRLVKEILKEDNLFDIFYIVVDEFQSIFTDSRFKSTTEMEFVNQLKDLQKVCYVSATPMIDEYLKDISEFSDLPYYEFNWTEEDPNRAIKPDLKVRVVKSITTQAVEIIKTYKNGEFDKSIKKDSSGNIQTIESREAVFYVNSVNNIISIINKAKLTPEECNIICSDTDKNRKKIRARLGRRFSIGDVPLQGESHKMFTFCTRTVYLGADFYSTNARSFILSDANSDCLAVDISLDLPQILGRQRNSSNPWKNRAEFYYKTLGKKKEITKEKFDYIIEQKKKETSDLIRSYNSSPDDAKQSLAKTYRKMAKAFNYKDNYVAVNEHGGSSLIPVLNNLVLIAERRAFDIQQIDYKDRFSVFNTIASEGLVSDGSIHTIEAFLSGFNECSDFPTRMKMLCEVDLTEQERCIVLDQIPITFKNYYETLGPNRCKALGYNKTYISKEYSDLQFDTSKISDEIYKKFEVNSKYTKSYSKEIIGNIYTSLGYNKTPKANDLEEYFELKECKILNPENGKREHGFEIIKKKEEGED